MRRLEIRRTLSCWTWTACVAAAVVFAAAPARAQDAVDRLLGRPVSAVKIDVDGRPDATPAFLALVETHVGASFSSDDLRRSLAQLFAAGRFDDVSVSGHDTADGVELAYHLTSLHEIDRLAFKGATGIDVGMLDRRLLDELNGLPSRSRIDAARAALVRVLQGEGYAHPAVTTEIVLTHAPDRATLVFTVDAGPQAHVDVVTVTGASPLSKEEIIKRTGATAGAAFRPRAIGSALDAITDDLRNRGYYEATTRYEQQDASVPGRVDVTIEVEAGPAVDLVFAGDPLPPGKPEDFVPIRREHSADADLLGDSTRHIEDVLRRDGYWKAHATFAPTEKDGRTVITITVTRGPRFMLRNVRPPADTHVPESTLLTLLNMTPGLPFDASRLTVGKARIKAEYLKDGFARVVVTSESHDVTDPSTMESGLVDVDIAIDEGPQTKIAVIQVQGNERVPTVVLTDAMTSRVDGPYVEATVQRDRDAVQLQYLNRGFDTARVEPHTQVTEDGQSATLLFEVFEGPQSIIDHVIVIGNRRTSSDTILSHVTLRPGMAYGLDDREKSLEALRKLGLFRRVRIDEAARPSGDTRADVIITVEEAPATTLGYGAGIEAGRHARAAVGGGLVERTEFAPRGSFDLGRRNLWGKNRSINFFSSVSLRPRDVPNNPQLDGRGFGFGEYNVAGTYVEPRLLGWNADGRVGVTFEQGVRTTFNFLRKGVNAEIVKRTSSHVSFVGRYSLDTTRIFDSQILPADQLLIDRVFPQVRLSTVAASVIRDTRNDAVDPERGSLMSVDGNLAARSLGSEVGFAKTYAQAIAFHRVPSTPRVVLAGAARVGLAWGFARDVVVKDAAGQVVLGSDGQPLMEHVDDVPASQRFFAGGPTTVRGFETDRLGVTAILTADGLSNGGNGLVILNGEVRVGVWKSLGAVGFIDSGNVFSKANQIDLGALRTSAGVGVRYKSPIGPIRLDVGFKLGALLPTDNRRSEFHFSIGEAF